MAKKKTIAEIVTKKPVQMQGEWDIKPEERQIVAPANAVKSEVKPIENRPPVPVLITGEGGRPRGYTTPEGKTFLGMKPSEVAEMLSPEPISVPTMPGKEWAQIRERQIAGAEALNQPRTPQLTALAPVKRTAGEIARAAWQGVKGAGAGAALGSVGGPVGAGIGAVTGAWIGATREITRQDKQDIGNANFVATQAQTNLQALINQANSGRIVSWAEWDKEIANLRAAEANFMKLKANDPNKMANGGFEEWAKLRSYLDHLDEAEAEFRMAMLAPNPAKIVQMQQQAAATQTAQPDMLETMGL